MDATARNPLAFTDHSIGNASSKITLIKYADYQCPYSAQAFPAIKETVEEYKSEINFVYRHFPLEHLHPSAMLLAQFAEAAALQGYFWETHEFIFSHQSTMSKEQLERFLGVMKIDVDKFYDDLRSPAVVDKVKRDIATGKEALVKKTPSFLLNGHLYQDEWHRSGLKNEVVALLMSQK